MDQPQAKPDPQSNISVRTGDSHEPAKLDQALVHQPLQAPSELRPWAILLLARVRDGDTVDQARERSGSRASRDSIHRYGTEHPDWYAALMDAQDASMAGELITSRDVARAHALQEEMRRHKLAMEASERYAHPYMQLGAQIRGDIGQGARVAVQVSTTFTVPMRSDTAPGRRVIEAQVDEAPPEHTPSDA